MYLEIQTNRKNPVGVFRESIREGDKIIKKNHGRVTGLTLEELKVLRDAVQGRVVPLSEFRITSSKEYGLSDTLIKLAKDIGLDKMIYSSTSLPWVKLSLGMVIGRILKQGSKLSLTRLADTSSLWDLLNYQGGTPDANDLYEAMDELGSKQHKIQKKIVQKHGGENKLLLYDITSSYLEGEYKDSEYVAFGYNRDKKKGHPQIVIGLVCNQEGCPLLVKVFKGNTKDRETVPGLIKALGDEYDIHDFVFVGDRGMLTLEGFEAFDEEFDDYKLPEYITALTHSQVKALCKEANVVASDLKKGPKEYKWSKYPELRFAITYNPTRAKESHETRQALIEKTKQELVTVQNRKRKVDDATVGVRVGKVINKYGVAKFFKYEIKDGKLYWEYNKEKIAEEEALDGVYVIVSDVSKDDMKVETLVDSYRNLSKVESAFRTLKGPSLQIRPIYHRKDDRIETHVFICFLAYYLEWHMLQRLKPLWERNTSGSGWETTLEDVLENLKAIRINKVDFNGYEVEQTTEPNEKQQEIIDLILAK